MLAGRALGGTKLQAGCEENKQGWRGSWQLGHHCSIFLLAHLLPAVCRARLATQQRDAEGKHWAHPTPEPAKGALLLASPLLFIDSQEYFYQSVILLLSHDKSGRCGIILNRPSQVRGTKGELGKGSRSRAEGTGGKGGQGGEKGGLRRLLGLKVVSILCRSHPSAPPLYSPAQPP